MNQYAYYHYEDTNNLCITRAYNIVRVSTEKDKKLENLSTKMIQTGQTSGRPLWPRALPTPPRPWATWPAPRSTTGPRWTATAMATS